jgi:hypothetical protein
VPARPLIYTIRRRVRQVSQCGQHQHGKSVPLASGIQHESRIGR